MKNRYHVLLKLSEWTIYYMFSFFLRVYRYRFHNGFVMGVNCTLTSKSMLVNLSTYIRNENENNSSTIEELRELKFQKCPIYSARIIRYALLVRYTSFQAYKLLLEEFSMPSLSLLEKISKGGVDPVKSAKLLLAKGRISEDVILMIDEMYLHTEIRGIPWW